MPDQPPFRSRWSRRHIVAAGAAATLAGAWPTAMRADTPSKKLEKPSLNLGLASLGSNFLPVYVAAARTWKPQGLNVNLVAFRGDSEVAQALAGNSIDISLASMNGLINMITAGQSVAAFYAGFDQADFAWLAQPSIKSWSDLKTKKIGVSTFGSLTDALTRYALKTHGINPERDVDIIQAGAAQAAFQALQSGTINAAILSPPFKWRAAEAGFTLLGTQEHDIAPRWPKNLFMAKTDFIAANPNTIEAFLRAHVDAIRFARANRNAAIAIIVDQLKYTTTDATRAYESAMDGIDERGNLPEPSMPTFWKVAIANGDVDKPWPEAKFLDRRFIDSFNRWAEVRS